MTWMVLAMDPAKNDSDAWLNPENPVTKQWQGKRLDLWSLKSPMNLRLQPLESDSWSRNPIDVFIRAKLDSMGWIPTIEASQNALIRLATFDLLGVPPTPEAIQAFLLDDAPDAYERLIDRLLASESYGVRWAQHWLDVVR